MNELKLGEVKEYNEMLQKAHQMLTEIDVPVAPMEMITIRVEDNPKRKYIAYCLETDDGFVLVLHQNHLKVKDKEVTFTSVLHELLHTCDSDGQKHYGIFEHNQKYMHYAQMVKKAYGYNPMLAITVHDLQYSHWPIVHLLKCDACGFEAHYYTVNSWGKMEQKLARHTRLKCPYCGAHIA